MTRQKETLIRKIALGIFFVLLLPLIVPLAIFLGILFFLHRGTLYLLVWLLWLPRGRDVLVVTSNSPIWHDYIASEVLPLVEKRAVILNWSERKKWPKWSFTGNVFWSFGGHQSFNPMVIVFPLFRPARRFRFWDAFKYWKRGNTEPLEHLRRELLAAL